MGSCNSQSRQSWTDERIVESWIPALKGMFTYDDDGKIVDIFHTDSEDFASRKAIVDQLYTLPILLQGKYGVTKDFLQKIEELQHARMM